MIGNLVLALGIACACGAPLVSEIQPRYVGTYSGTSVQENIHSNALDADVFCYSRGHLYLADADFTNIQYSWRYILGTDGWSNTAYINYSNPPVSNLGTMANAMQYAYWQSDTVDSRYCFVFIQKVLQGIYQFRCFVPLNSGIGGIEIISHGNDQYGVYLGDSFSSNNSSYLNEGDMDCCIIDNLTQAVGGDFYTSNFPFKFASYCFMFLNDDDLIDFDIYLYGNLNDNYNTGYQSGFNAGYYEGQADGYITGYAEGLRVSQSSNASFLSLMSSIADTPIRFLKQMFSFELFGMNVAVVILSCLTAVVIFGIVKKVWK